MRHDCSQKNAYLLCWIGRNNKYKKPNLDNKILKEIYNGANSEIDVVSGLLGNPFLVDFLFPRISEGKYENGKSMYYGCLAKKYNLSENLFCDWKKGNFLLFIEEETFDMIDNIVLTEDPLEGDEILSSRGMPTGLCHGLIEIDANLLLDQEEREFLEYTLTHAIARTGVSILFEENGKLLHFPKEFL